ncbi:MAG: hypothetical protein IKU86_07020 [Thermoguttaceae bacterium]|nr:hypothetical protein [Thermoguttaceae bacterium]
MSSQNENTVTLESLRSFFRKIYFGENENSGTSAGLTTKERVDLLFQMAHEYRNLFCHENELLNQRKCILGRCKRCFARRIFLFFTKRIRDRMDGGVFVDDPLRRRHNLHCSFSSIIASRGAS